MPDSHPAQRDRDFSRRVLCRLAAISSRCFRRQIEDEISSVSRVEFYGIHKLVPGRRPIVTRQILTHTKEKLQFVAAENAVTSHQVQFRQNTISLI